MRLFRPHEAGHMPGVLLLVRNPIPEIGEAENAAAVPDTTTLKTTDATVKTLHGLKKLALSTRIYAIPA
jgi:hypothetical protein